MRQSMSLDEKRIGDIVYSTGDSPTEAGARDLEAFDREFAAAPADLGRLVPGVDRVEYREDWEIAQ
jgi:hypothetical protein